MNENDSTTLDYRQFELPFGPIKNSDLFSIHWFRTPPSVGARVEGVPRIGRNHGQGTSFSMEY